jgi:xylulokinase
VPLVLGVDSSTQATKVEVRDADDGRLIATGRAPHPSTTPPRSEQDPRAWWAALVDAVRQSGVRDIAALSVAGQQHGLVVLGRDGEVLRPAKLWNDTESAPEAAALVEQLGAEQWAKACGSVPVAAFTITKLAWLARHEPDTFARVATVLLPHDYLTYRLTGRFVTDRGDASGTGYWSPGDEAWMPELLERSLGAGAAPGLDSLPEVLGPYLSPGVVTQRACAELGARGEIVCGPGTGDNMAAALGIGLRAGDVALSIGTSGTVYTVSDTPTADPSGAVAGFADATGRFLPLVCTLNATLVTDAFARLLAVDTETGGRLALRAPAGAAGVVVVPYLSGERTPNRPDATGTIAGMRIDTGREHLARAAFEGVVCGLLEGLDALRTAGAVPATERDRRTMLVGGGARSPAYQRIVADLAGVDIVLPEGDEHVAAGACVQAAAILHGKTSEEVASAWGFGTGRTVTPDPNVDRAAIRSRYAEERR